MNKPGIASHISVWRQKPLVRAVALATTALFAPSMYAAAPPPLPIPRNALPVQAQNWLVHGDARMNTVGNTMTIDQNTAKAILDWRSFNIGQDAKVEFNQPSSNASVLNRIKDQSITQILGQLKANGNVYLVNNNGILFGSGAQVNVHGLVASTMNIDANQYINSSLVAAINDRKAALEGGSSEQAILFVEQGARIATDEGGQVILAAPGVLNSGEISTPGGQAVLAGAKDKVYLAVSDRNSDLRGLLIEVGEGGSVANVGKIIAERGNITLLGLAVNQSGSLRATTSVDVNGSIRLVARDRAELSDQQLNIQASLPAEDRATDRLPSGAVQAIAHRSGTVTLGKGSVTEVAVVDASQDTGASSAQAQSTPRIDVVGKRIELQDSSTVRARGGRVNVVATATPDDLDAVVGRNDSRITVGANATVDVSGEKTELDMSSRVVKVELRGDELKDAPLQRNGFLHGKTVWVDIDRGSPLISDLSPTLAKVKHTVTERLAAGGTINLSSQGDVVMGDNAHLNIAGGSVSYRSGTVNTTKLKSKGRIVDIGAADPTRTYDGIFGEHEETHAKWGKAVFTSKSFSTYREGFTEGRAGGALNIDTQTMYGFDRVDLQAGATTGLFQRAGAKLPQRASVNVSLGQGPAAASNSVQNVVIRNIASSAPLGIDDDYVTGKDADGNDLFAPLNISAGQLNRSGVGRFTLAANGTILQEAGAAIALQPGSGIALSGTGVWISGSISAPGGSIDLVAKAPDDGENHDAEKFSAVLWSGAVLDTSGSWVNDLLAGLEEAGDVVPSVVNGGSIGLRARNELIVAQGSLLRSDAGAQLTSRGSRVLGKGGSIALSSVFNDAMVKLDGALSAFGFSGGGTLNLALPRIDIGARPAGASTDDPWLGTDFFTRSGFGQYNLTAAAGDLVVHGDANLALGQQNLLFGDLWRASRQATRSNIRTFTTVEKLPDWSRAPTGLALATAPDTGGDIRVEAGARIATDPRGTVALRSSANLFMDGAIVAKGGTIDLQITGTGAARSVDPTQMLWVGSNAVLDAGATRTDRFNRLGLLDGDIADAGSIRLQATRGAIVTAPGSSMDVSGAAYAQDYVRTGAVQRDVVNAAAGSIALTAANGIAAFGAMKGTAAGDGRGGSLTYKLDAGARNVVNDTLAEYNDRTISVVDSLPAWDGSIEYGAALPAAFAFRGVVAADTVAQGGFANLTLAANNLAKDSALGGFGRISFDSDVALAVRDTLILGATNIAVHDHEVRLFAPIVQIGQQLGAEENATTISQMVDTPVAGDGGLAVDAQFMELLGNIGIGGTRGVAFNSANDIRLRAPVNNDGRFSASTLSTAGDLSLQASQVYGSTLTDYTFALLGADSTFKSTASGGARSVVLSAASRLTVAAPHIDIAGTLLAPLGALTLNATKDVRLRTGAVLDVSAGNQQIPFGRIQGGDILWSYLINPSKAPLLIDKAPEKSVAISAPVVSMEQGSQINVSGGGDVYGIEQIPGTGGSRDFLDPANSGGAFAVVPWLNTSISPFDVVEMTGFQIDGKGPKVGDVVYLDGANGLPAGNYAVLPAHYALLDGAYLVTPKSGAWQPGQSQKQIDGSSWVSGRYGRAFGAGFDGQWQGFLIEPGSAARTRSEYNIVTSTKFFADKRDSANTGDAGRVQIAVNDQLDLLGSIVGAAAQNGRKAQLDIIADEIEVVNQRDANSGAVQLRASDLNGVGVDSVLLGGWRSGNRTEVGIDVRSNSVHVRDGATLTVPDILMAARDGIVLDKGATVAGVGASTAAVQVFKIDGDGALLRASSAAQADVSRTNASGTSGTIEIAAGAKVVADYSILLDSSRDMTLDGDIGLNARTRGATSLNLTANRISLGDGSDAATDGLKFTNAQLTRFNAQELRLSSRSTIDFYGDVALQNQRVQLNTGELRSTRSGTVQLRAADTLQLDNTLNAGINDTSVPLFDASAPDDRIAGANLVLSARNLVLGNDRDVFGKLIANPVEHRMKISGFERVDLGAAGATSQLVGQGNFTLFGSADVHVIADRVGGDNGATTSIQVRDGTGVIDLRAANAGAFPVATLLQDISSRLGARLTLAAKSIAQGTHIDLPSGVLTMRATGADAGDNVALLAGSVTDVSGRSMVFPQGSTVVSDGGEIHLNAAAGDVVGAAGAKVVLGGSGAFDGATLASTGAGSAGKVTLGGGSGLLDIVAKGRAVWQAGIQARAGSGADGKREKGGSLQLDVGGFDGGAFGGWLQTIADGGIDQRVSIRSRSGDLVVDRQVRAADISVSADSGDVTLAATLDARGSDGGRVALWGGNDLNIADGARIDAGAAAAGGRGGRVELGARDGTLAFGAGTALNVAGKAGVDGQPDGRAGSVLLRAPRTATNDDVQIANNGVKIDGAARIELEAFRSYDASIDGTVASVITGAFSDAQQFMNDATAQGILRGRFAEAAPAGVFHVTPGIDIFSTGDLALTNNLALNTRRYGAVAGVFDGEAGVLSLRAAGNLTIAGDLNDGWFAPTNAYASHARIRGAASKVLMRDYSWDYRLVGGGDLSAADPTAVQRLGGATGQGMLTVSGDKDIVTGAGWIGMYAGNGVDVQGSNSVIAILGRTDYTTYANLLRAGSAPAFETLPDTGSIDPYHLITMTGSGGAASAVSAKYPFYPKDGGDLTVSAGNDVSFAPSTTLFNDWMQRVADNAMTLGNANGVSAQVVNLTTWGVTVDALTQGIAVLGGGNASFKAGNDVTNLNVALPVTAKQVGTNGANTLSITGGGNLSVSAGGDILSPRLWVDRGRLDVAAGGSLGAAAGELGPLLALADTTVDIDTRGDATIAAAFNSTMMPISKKSFVSTNVGSLQNYFFTYSDEAAISVSSLQGDVVFANDYEAIADTTSLRANWPVPSLNNSSEFRLFSVYPGQLSGVAINRNVRIENGMTLFPSASGQLVLLAGNDVSMAEDATGTSESKLNLSDADPQKLPRFDHPVTRLFADGAGADSTLARLIGEVSGASNPFWHAATPLHVADRNPAIIAALNDVGTDGNMTFELAKPVRVYAGNDVRNVTLSIQHSNAAQVSEIVAGRDVAFPLIANSLSGTVEATPLQYIRVSGPGRLDVIAGRDVDLGGSTGIVAAANLYNPALPEQGANVNVLAGINGPSALSDPILYAQFADRYFGAASNVGGTYIDWFLSGAFRQSTTKEKLNLVSLVGVFTGRNYADDASALADFRTLPVLTQQAISLEAYQIYTTPAPGFRQPTDFASLQALGGDLGAALQKVTGNRYEPTEYASAINGLSKAQQSQVARTLADSSSATAKLIQFVSLERFGGDLGAAVGAVTGASYADNAQAAAALAKLPAAQQQLVARRALDGASSSVRRELLIDVYADVVRNGGAQQAIANNTGVVLEASEGYNRGYAAIEAMFPGTGWKGDAKFALSAVRTFGDGDINLLVPGGRVDVGLANKIAGIDKAPSELGVIVNGYGQINGIASGNFNINQSRMFTLGNGDATVWSSYGDVDAGKGAKTALSVQPPKIVFSADGSSKLVYTTPVAGSGINANGPKTLQAADRGPLPLDADDRPLPLGDTRSSRLRYVRSLSEADSYLFAPQGKINAGDAGISVGGDLLLAANQVLGADNISVGGVAVGVPASTSISAGTLSLGNVAASATENAANAMNNAVSNAAAAAAAGNAAFVTVDIIGVGQ